MGGITILYGVILRPSASEAEESLSTHDEILRPLSFTDDGLRMTPL
jgi:hypothetical protein